MKIAIVNDDANQVSILKHILDSSKEHQVIWSASNGKYAIEKCRAQTPDILLMDLIMPVMNGVDATREIMKHTPCAILIVTASVNSNAAKVFEAMGAGALDAINTPVPDSPGRSAEQLMTKIRTVSRLIRHQQHGPVSLTHNHNEASGGRAWRALVLIGASTGGPSALVTTLSRLPADFPAPVVIVQHVDKYFSSSFAGWLDEHTALKVVTAEHGDIPTPGKVYVAATGSHLVIGNDSRLYYNSEPSALIYKPSVNELFDSACRYWQGQLYAVLLTGMGNDGASGLLNIREHGGYTIAQNRESCTVYGMPKAAIEMNAADEILDINLIPERLAELVASGNKAVAP